MLAKKYRLSAEKDINRFFGLSFKKANGQSASSKNLLIKTLPNQLGHSRFGFIVNLKVDKRAVVRNLLKRRLREIVKKQLKKINSPADFLTLALPPAKKLDYHDLEKEVIDLLKKMKKI